VTFSEAYALHGPDVPAISIALGIPEHKADRLINDRLNRLYANRASWQVKKTQLADLRKETA